MKTTASMRKRINSLLEELGEGWSEGNPSCKQESGDARQGDDRLAVR